MMQVAATILIILGLFSKFSAFFVTMPNPVIVRDQLTARDHSLFPDFWMRSGPSGDPGERWSILYHVWSCYWGGDLEFKIL